MSSYLFCLSDIMVSSSSLLTLSCFFTQRQNRAALNWSVSCFFDSSEGECWGKLTSSTSSLVDMDLIWPWGFEVPVLIHLPSCAIISSNHINSGFKGSGQMFITFTGPRSACICVEGGARFFSPESEAPRWKTLNTSAWNFHFPFWSCSAFRYV